MDNEEILNKDVRMKMFEVLNDDGNIKVSKFANPSAKFQDGIYSEVEEMCVYDKTFNIYDLVSNYEQLQQENQELKMIIKEYERLDKENGKSFKITSVKQYNIDKLVKCEENWNELKDYIQKICYYDEVGLRIIDPSCLEDKIAELESGVNDEKYR